MDLPSVAREALSLDFPLVASRRQDHNACSSPGSQPTCCWMVDSLTNEPCRTDVGREWTVSSAHKLAAMAACGYGTHHSITIEKLQMIETIELMTERVARLREDGLSRDLKEEMPELRGQLAEKALEATLGKPQAIRIAEVLETVFNNVPVQIRHGELLVGSRGASGYPEVDHAMARGSAEYPYMISDFQTLLEIGVRGVIERAEARLAAMDEADPDQMESVHFLQAVIKSCQAVIVWAERYAEEADRQAADTDDEDSRDELAEIAARCRRVPAQPAESFADALQSVWFLYVALYLETRAASCLGRLDQYLLPYYERDLATGRLTRDEAKELLCCLWVKLYENVQGVLGSHAQTITLGGMLPDRSSGVNDLSFLCIEVAEAMGNVGAQIAVRWFEGQPPELLDRAFSLMEQKAVMPQMFNDETYIAALDGLGVPFEDASQFALFGCHEPVISGMGYQRPASYPGYVSFYDWLEKALGLQSFGTPPQLRVVADPPVNVRDFWERWKEAMRQGVRDAVIRANFGDKIKQELLPRPLMSAFLKDCIESGADLTQGGARYNMTGFQGCALATSADSFVAVKELVFEQQRIPMSELIDAVAADYSGYEHIRLAVTNQPSKYGTDCEDADIWAQRMVDAFCDEIETHRNFRGGPFSPGMWSFVQNVHMGKRTAASPDGRRAGEPISHSMDPVSGQAVRGPTAVLNSAAKLSQTRFSNGGSLLLEFSRSVIADECGRLAARSLCEAYFRMGGIEIQLSCSSAEQLMEAREHPERYRDLVVRVAGYSDFFVRLDPALQNYIIEREKHTLSGQTT